jgi:hypothetical protein
MTSSIQSVLWFHIHYIRLVQELQDMVYFSNLLRSFWMQFSTLEFEEVVLIRRS